MRKRSLFPLLLLLASCGDCGLVGVGTTSDTGGTGTSDMGSTADDGTVDPGDTGGAIDMGTDATSAGDAGIPDMAICPAAQVCADTCCEVGEDCVDGSCLPACEGTRCGAMSELCCEGADVCIFDSCQTPGDACQSSFQCPEDEYCEPTLGACIPRDAINVVCEFIPPVGDFTPSPENQYPGLDTPEGLFSHSITTPTVADIDADGIPEIAALLYRDSLAEATLVVLNGEDMSVVATGGQGLVQTNSAGIAVANIDPATPELEIVAQRVGGGLIAFGVDTANQVLVELWSNTTGNLAGITSESAPAIADLDQDGSPEVFLGFSVVDAAGAIWNGLDGGAAGGQSANSAITTAVDIDQAVGPNGEMELELVAGNRVMKLDGTMLWDRSATYADGFPAVGDLDGDGSPEVVNVSSGQVMAFSADGQTVVFGPIAIPGGGQGGPPTIADFDGDGRREIAAAGQGQYTVFDPDCTGATPDVNFCPTGGAGEGVLWTVMVQDLSSSRTGSSVFDFEGDGKAEVVYNDECYLRVFDGQTGDVLFERANTTRTGSEFPIIADVDADFNAEIVVVSNNDQIDRDQCEANFPGYPAGGTEGIFVYGDANDNWVTTRGVWNQHAYHITNILADGTVPQAEPTHYARAVTNSFRLNVQPDGLFNAPDLTIENVEIRNPSCGDTVTVEIAVTVTNEGALGVGAGTPVDVTATNANGETADIGTVMTTRRLLPSESETILVSFTLPAGWENEDFTVEGIVDPDGAINECVEGNNVGTGDSQAGNRTFDDLVITDVSVGDATCGVDGTVDISVTIENQGQMTVPGNLPIVIEAVRGMSATPIETVRTSGGLQGGRSETFTVTWTAPASLIGQQFDVRATIDPNGEATACSSDTQSAAADCLPPQ